MGLTHLLYDVGNKDVNVEWLSNPNLISIGFPCWDVTKAVKQGFSWEDAESKMDRLAEYLVKLPNLKILIFVMHYLATSFLHPYKELLGHFGHFSALSMLVHETLLSVAHAAGVHCSLEELRYQHKRTFQIRDTRTKHINHLNIICNLARIYKLQEEANKGQ